MENVILDSSAGVLNSGIQIAKNLYKKFAYFHLYRREYTWGISSQIFNEWTYWFSYGNSTWNVHNVILILKNATGNFAEPCIFEVVMYKVWLTRKLLKINRCYVCKQLKSFRLYHCICDAHIQSALFSRHTSYEYCIMERNECYECNGCNEWCNWNRWKLNNSLEWMVKLHGYIATPTHVYVVFVLCYFLLFLTLLLWPNCIEVMFKFKTSSRSKENSRLCVRLFCYTRITPSIH